MADLFGWYNPGDVDPLSSPMFFGTGAGGDDTALTNTYRDSLFANVFAGVPGIEAFYRASPGGDDTSAAGINPEQLQAWLAQNGYKLRHEPRGDGGRIWAEDAQGRQIGQPQEYSNADSNFAAAALAAVALAGGAVAMNPAFGGLGAAGAGATEAGIGTLTSPLMQAAPLAQAAPLSMTEAALAGAGSATAGVAASATPAASAAFDPISAYLNTGAVEGSTMLNSITGAGGAAGAVGAGSAAASWDSLLQGLSKGLSSGGARSIFDIASGIYGLNLASDARKASDPFAPYRGYYGQQLAALEANPGSITSRPGWRAGFEGIDRGMAARGYYGSGNMDAVRTRYAGDFYTQEANRLAQLAGAGQTPGAGQIPSAQLAGQGLASIGYGLAPWVGGRPA